jgi:SAM-dependent methyltransferase
MPWYWDIAEAEHDIQNPTSREKLLQLGGYLRLDPETRVLDVACGKCGPAILFAQAYGCRILGIEKAPEFVAEAHERIEAAGVSHLIEVVEGDAKAVPLEPEAFDVTLCLGATFAYDGLPGTLDALVPATRIGGRVAVGEPYWREWPLPAGVDDMACVPLRETLQRFEAAGLALTGIIESSLQDWDRYESQHWRALEDWLAANPDDPDAPAIRTRHEKARSDYFAWERRLLAWAIFVSRKP